MRRYLLIGALLALGVLAAFLLARWFVFYQAYPSSDKYDEYVSRQEGGKVCCGDLYLLDNEVHDGAVLGKLVIDKDLRVIFNRPCSDSSYRVATAMSDSIVILDPDDRLRGVVPNVAFACWNLGGDLSLYLNSASGVYLYPYGFDVVPYGVYIGGSGRSNARGE